MGRRRTVLPGHDRIKRHHTGQARIWYAPPHDRGQWFHLGPWDDVTGRPSDAAMAAYWRLVDAIKRDAAGPARRSTDWLVVEMLAEYYAKVKPKLTDRARRHHVVMIRRMSERYPEASVREFGPAQLTDWLAWLGETMTRSTIAKERRILFSAFRWAFTADRVRVAETRWPELQLVKLPDECRPAKRVNPVPIRDVAATLRRLRPTVATMVRLQWRTGMRPGEVYVMRPMDICRDGKATLPNGAVIDVDRVNDGQAERLWLYVVPPHGNKTDHHGHDRYVWLAPRVQRLIAPFLDRPANALMFTPRQSVAEWRAVQRGLRASNVQPSQVSRAKGSPRKRAGDAFADSAYRQAIGRAATAAGVAPWNPYQLRHTFLSRVRDASGRTAAMLVAGHRDSRVTEGYTRTATEAARAAEAVRGMWHLS